MPAVSQAQAKMMGAVAGGSIKKTGLSRSVAKAFLRGVDVSRLPARKTKRDLKTALLGRD